MPFTVSAPDDGAAQPDEQTSSYQQALLRERDGYVRRGDAKRVADVEAALIASGFELVERADSPAPAAEQATTRSRRK